MLPPKPLSRAQKAAVFARQRLTRQDAGAVLFSSFLGAYSDNPRAIHEELVRRGLAKQNTWVRSPGAEAPGGATVAPRTREYVRALARSAVVVANTSLPYYAPRRSAAYVQTWHGTPLKRIGFDNVWRRDDPRALRASLRDYRNWTHLVSQNAFSTEVFRRAFRYEGEVLEVGYPRNDVLKSEQAGAVRHEMRRRLGIDEGVTAVLYAPTFRDDEARRTDGRSFSLELDLARLEQALGESHVVLLRLHYLVAASQGDVPSSFVRNVSSHGDIRDLYLAADVLLTDYSSAMFDFSVTGKPMAFYTYDLERYRDDLRGFYFDITEQAPGPLCRTTDEVVQALGALDPDDRHISASYAEFVGRYAYLDDGHAAARVVDRIWGTKAT